MKTLTVAEAVEAVRKNLDEQGLNDSVMYSDENKDNESFDLVIAKTLPEAINDVNLTALPEEMEGKDISADITYAENLSPDGLEFTIPEDKHFLRLVALSSPQLSDIVTDVIAEASPEGRKQLNPHIRGTYDRPRLVQMQGNVTEPVFRLYSLKELPEDADGNTVTKGLLKLSIAGRLEYSADTTSYDVSSALAQRVIYHLTSLVLSVFGETEKAKYFDNLASQSK